MNEYDALSSAAKIQAAIDKIEENIAMIPEAAFEKANSLAAYDRAIAITILKIKNGVMKSWEFEPGNTLQLENLSVTLIPTVAKGICAIEALQKEQGEAGYKGLIVTIDAFRSILNGFQSILKIIQ